MLTALALIAVLAVVYAVTRGQDVNWDQRNYHIYDAWALLNGRTFTNLWPAQIQTFFNPLPSLLPYAFITTLPPLLAGAALALVQAINIGLVLAIALRLWPATGDGLGRDWARRWLVIGSAVVIGATAPMFVSEIGTTFPDSTTSIPLLAGLLFLLRHLERRTLATVLVAGALFGLAMGLKLTNGVYFIGVLAWPWWLQRGRAKTLKTLAVFSIAAFAGFAAAQGYWSLELWLRFGSPLFPLYNALFKSPWFEFADFADSRFLPSSPLDALSYPFQWLLGRHPSSELVFRDARFAVMAGLAVVVALLIATRRARAVQPGLQQRWLVIGFTGVSFVVWIALFGISRYLVPLELLSGTVVVGLAGIALRERWLAPISVTLAVALVGWTVPPDWGRMAWSTDWFGVELPVELQRDDELFVMVGGEPTAYVVPFLPADAVVVRIDGNMRPGGVPGRERLSELVRQAIDDHEGPIFSLALAPPSPDQLARLDQFGLRTSTEPCVSFETRMDHIVSCPLTR